MRLVFQFVYILFLAGIKFFGVTLQSPTNPHAPISKKGNIGKAGLAFVLNVYILKRSPIFLPKLRLFGNTP